MKEEVFVRRTMIIRELQVSFSYHDEHVFKVSSYLKSDLSLEVEIFVDRVMIICNDLHIIVRGKTIAQALEYLSDSIVDNFNLLMFVTDECLDQYFLDLRDKYHYYLQVED